MPGPVQYKWYKIAESEKELPFAENQVAVTTANGKMICIGKYNNELYAFSYKCPHASGIMADGYIDAVGNIVCPVHRYKFSLSNGRSTTGEGYYLKRWPVECRETGIYVGMEQTGLFNWP